eukprot:3286229-Amphidinium_carterae.1
MLLTMCILIFVTVPDSDFTYQGVLIAFRRNGVCVCVCACACVHAISKSGTSYDGQNKTSIFILVKWMRPVNQSQQNAHYNEQRGGNFK